MNSFNLGNFPNLDRVKSMIANDFKTAGKISSCNDFRAFCETCNITDISDRYYSEFVSRFDQKLFCD